MEEACGPAGETGDPAPCPFAARDPVIGGRAVFEMDMDGSLIMVPPDLEEITGFSKEELLVLSLHNITCMEDRYRVENAISAIRSGVPIVISEISVFSETRGSHPIELLLLPRCSEGVVRSIRGSIKDIQRTRDLESELRSTVERQEASKRFLSDFVSLLTREIRQPLTTIMLTLEMLDSGSFGELNELQRSKLEQMLDVLDRLKETLNEALEMSRNIEEDRLEKGKASLESLVEDVVLSASEGLDARGITVSRTFPREMTAIELDIRAMRQVISVLFHRALSHSPDGGQINIGIGDQDDELSFSISDSGEGIPEEILPLLFNKFQTTPELESKEFSEGLNLYIARKVVERHGGRIWCESFVGIGTTILFVIPRGRGPEVSA